MASYYPRKVATIQDLQKLYPEFDDFIDEDEEDRLEGIKMWVVLLLQIWQILTTRQCKGKRKGSTKEEEDGRRYDRCWTRQATRINNA